MFIITHDLEAALVCDKTAILRKGRLLDFDTPENLIGKLPSDGLLARLTINDLSQEKIETIKKFKYCEKVARVGNDQLECFLEDFNENLEEFVDYLLEKDVGLSSMTRDIANFRRYFQIRIQEEEEKERRLESEQEEQEHRRKRQRQENLRKVQENAKILEKKVKEMVELEKDLEKVRTMENLIPIGEKLGDIKGVISKLEVSDDLDLPSGEESRLVQYLSDFKSAKEKSIHLLNRCNDLERKMKLKEELEKLIIDAEKVKLEELNEVLQRKFNLSRTEFLAFIYDWTEEYHVRINGNLMFINKNDLFRFIEDLNREVQLWKKPREESINT